MKFLPVFCLDKRTIFQLNLLNRHRNVNVLLRKHTVLSFSHIENYLDRIMTAPSNLCDHISLSRKEFGLMDKETQIPLFL